MSVLSLPWLGPLARIDVILFGWFALTACSVAYVAYDAFTNNPEMTVMKWGWVLVTMYLGPIGYFLYVLSCQEPAPGTHEEFVKPLWKQGLGSTIHCVAGDMPTSFTEYSIVPPRSAYRCASTSSSSMLPALPSVC